MKKIFALLTVLALAAFSANAQQLMAGAAKVDVTPAESDLKNPTDIIRGRLYVRALYVTDGKTPVAICTVDGDLRETDEAIRRSSATSGIPATNYVISGTHTHSPSTGGLGNNGKPSYEDYYVAIEKAVREAKAAARPAKVGYGKRPIDLSVNRDLFNENLQWSQSPDWNGVSDKDLSVLAFLDSDNVPIAIYLNYAMHPVNFYMSGVISADFPGDACDFLEKAYGEKTIALFSQNASGDQNPKLAYSDVFREGQLKAVRTPRGAMGGNRNNNANPTPEQQKARQAVLDLKNEYVHMLGTSIGFKAMEIMLYDMTFENAPVVRAAEKVISIPGRRRVDNNGRENVEAEFEPTDDVHVGVGVVRIGDINMVTVSAEIYAEIGLHIKRASPSSKTMVVSIADGPFETGYIYSDNATYHKTFQVLGSRVQPGYAEKGIVNAALELMNEVK
ncbi:MAG: neutral/alkaline non-lysosomal ceramidase N-terminal domain-containing protein [Bacteroidales bacterium]|nr:neutral/alkaline non-lysosomal ceramidase N-terminal domain-containing protein [Bacteroidales bacterium]MBQ9173047.1 neutral/alkaline non-lysosomal ceramidase N-terminal domain-containing protein [Bacteroidales bacterium]